MSVSKWRYTEECNGRPCPGDCDCCSFEPGDLISRADAIEAVGEWMQKEYGYLDLNRAERLIGALSALPSADAVQGEWIFNTDENNGKSWNICSVCGYSLFHTTNYCPSCGAIMFREESEVE